MNTRLTVNYQPHFTPVFKLKIPIFNRKVIDIGSSGQYPADILSNFTESHFELDGKQINSMEGFLQSLKTPNKTEQEDICKLIGIKAKRMSRKFKKRPEYSPEFAYWNGKPYKRNSRQFWNLLKRAYEAKYDADDTFRSALSATKGTKLTHSIGKNSSKETILTEKEFIDLLQYLKFKYKYKRNVLKTLSKFKKFLLRNTPTKCNKMLRV